MGAGKRLARRISLLKHAKTDRHVLHVGRDYLKKHRKAAARSLRRSGKLECSEGFSPEVNVAKTPES